MSHAFLAVVWAEAPADCRSDVPHRPARVDANSVPPGEEPKTELPSASRRAAGKWRTVVIALTAWLVSVSLVGFLALRHAKVAPRNRLAPSAAPSSVCTRGFDNTLMAEIGRHQPIGAAVNDALGRAAHWNPPIAKGNPSASDRNAALEIKPDDHSLGSHKAEVTLMLFGDLDCPFTLRLIKVLREWLDEQPSAFRLVWRERPLDVHPNAGKAALIAERLALRSGETALWRFITAVSELKEDPSEDNLSALDIGLQPAKPKLDEARATTKAEAKLERDRLIALGYAIHATPTLFVNGLRIEGEISRQHLEQLISEEKEEVQALLDDSVPATKTYSIRVEANLLDLQERE